MASGQTVPAKQAPPAVAGRTPADPRVAGAGQQVSLHSPQDTGAVMQRSGGSLFKASLSLPPDPSRARLRDVSFIGVPEPEPRTLKKHDLVTIVVREESAFSSTGNTETKRESDIEARVDEFIKLKLGNFALQGGAQGITPPAVKLSGNRNFKGEGTVDRTDSLTARMTGEIVDVKPNGTLVVQARKTIKTDDEVQQFVLTGICRAEDVNADNTVLSTQMYDLQLQKNSKGAVRDATKRGLLHNLLDFLNPF
jgi:flagellar L-ring protein precursor FlgH